MAKGDIQSGVNSGGSLGNMGMGQGNRGQLTSAPQMQRPNIGSGPSSNNLMQMLQQVAQGTPQQGPGGGGKHGGGYGGGLGGPSQFISQERGLGGGPVRGPGNLGGGLMPFNPPPGWTPGPHDMQSGPIDWTKIMGPGGNKQLPDMGWQNMPGVTRQGSNLMSGGQQMGHVGNNNQAVWNNGMGPFDIRTMMGSQDPNRIHAAMGGNPIQRPMNPSMQPSFMGGGGLVRPPGIGPDGTAGLGINGQPRFA